MRTSIRTGRRSSCWQLDAVEGIKLELFLSWEWNTVSPRSIYHQRCSCAQGLALLSFQQDRETWLLQEMLTLTAKTPAMLHHPATS